MAEQHPDFATLSYQMQRMQSDLTETREHLRSVDKLLREGEGGLPMTTRLVLVENRVADLGKRLDDFRDTQKMGRDWWMKVLGNLTVAALLAGAGLVLSLYMLSKGASQTP